MTTLRERGDRGALGETTGEIVLPAVVTSPVRDRPTLGLPPSEGGAGSVESTPKLGSSTSGGGRNSVKEPAAQRPAERQEAAARLRLAGQTYEQIADALGYADKSGAYRAVRAALRNSAPESVEELRTLEAARLDAMHAALWPAAMEGEVQAVDALLRISKRRSGLFNLDSPKRIDWRAEIRKRAIAEGLDPDEMVAEAERVLREQ